jgi:hypothetical protein
MLNNVEKKPDIFSIENLRTVEVTNPLILELEAKSREKGKGKASSAKSSIKSITFFLLCILKAVDIEKFNHLVRLFGKYFPLSAKAVKGRKALLETYTILTWKADDDSYMQEYSYKNEKTGRLGKRKTRVFDINVDLVLQFLAMAYRNGLYSALQPADEAVANNVEETKQIEVVQETKEIESKQVNMVLETKQIEVEKIEVVQETKQIESTIALKTGDHMTIAECAAQRMKDAADIARIKAENAARRAAKEAEIEIGDDMTKKQQERKNKEKNLPTKSEAFREAMAPYFDQFYSMLPDLVPLARLSVGAPCSLEQEDLREFLESSDVKPNEDGLYDKTIVKDLLLSSLECPEEGNADAYMPPPPPPLPKFTSEEEKNQYNFKSAMGVEVWERCDDVSFSDCMCLLDIFDPKGKYNFTASRLEKEFEKRGVKPTSPGKYDRDSDALSVVEFLVMVSPILAAGDMKVRFPDKTVRSFPLDEEKRKDIEHIFWEWPDWAEEFSKDCIWDSEEIEINEDGTKRRGWDEDEDEE